MCCCLVVIGEVCNWFVMGVVGWIDVFFDVVVGFDVDCCFVDFDVVLFVVEGVD